MDKREFMLQGALMSMRAGRDPYVVEQSVGSCSSLYDAIIAATPTEADEGWNQWFGVMVDAPNGTVEVQYESGQFETNDADNLAWDLVGGPGDIARWRFP